MNGRRLILHMSVSLDGFAAGPDHVVDWMGEGGGHGDQRHRMNLELVGSTTYTDGCVGHVLRPR